jgi:hypothetical protein
LVIAMNKPCWINSEPPISLNGGGASRHVVLCLAVALHGFALVYFRPRAYRLPLSSCH